MKNIKDLIIFVMVMLSLQAPMMLMGFVIYQLRNFVSCIETTNIFYMLLIGIAIFAYVNKTYWDYLQRQYIFDELVKFKNNVEEDLK